MLAPILGRVSALTTAEIKYPAPVHLLNVNMPVT